jgi:uncharacterized membrane protein
LFSFLKIKKAPLLSPEQEEQVVAAIQQAERATSGEIRVFAESKCSFVNPVDRAAEIFHSLKMENTEDRNAVLIYIAIKDRQLALFADKGIYERMGKVYWENEVNKMIGFFKAENLTEGLCTVITEIGNALLIEFPYEKEDRNELPDAIVFGK